MPTKDAQRARRHLVFKVGRSVARVTPADKVGTVFVDTNCMPFAGFPVASAWILELLHSHRMTYQTARLELVRCAKDVLQTIATVDQWRQEMQAAQLKAHVKQVQAALSAQRRAFVIIPEVEAWVAEHEEVRDRYKFLVLTGKSGLGKTEYAMGLVALGKGLELNMAATNTPDLRQYDSSTHDLLLFDEMHAKDILLHKKLFLSPPRALTMGYSGTNCTACAVWVHQKLIVVCTSRWDQ